ncbi:Signal transduction histidine kinase [Sphingomonas sp. OV641]|uniref:HAMP domain-containing sensor histidine kinase n=1 Tax=Sphingomonas sp. OV641 TaxID=1881068 RepID=UPI0008CAE83C|nr:ATP-binding protein [Sphingomonas sp. OV641]SEJ06266.1 Signal transduction histidine kinase [Sphingomonas sp. OV641]
MKLPYPRNLSGQLALLLALALFAAQAINLALVLRERANFRLAQATRPAAVRIADALDHAMDRRTAQERSRVRRRDTNPIPSDLERMPMIAAELRTQLAELGISAGRIDTGIRLRIHEPKHRGDRLIGRHNDTLLIAVQLADGSWITTNAPWPRRDNRILWALLSQTLIIYILILLPVLWITRRISRPLRGLAGAARSFAPRKELPPLPVEGPSDVRDVIVAFNGLAQRVTAMLDEKDRMLGAIGHDLRTPLAALRVRIESVEDEQDRARMADTIAEMSRTLDDILSLARLGRPSEPVTEVDLNALVDAVVDDFHDLGAEVLFEADARLRMHLRPTLFRRAVRNLIENAIKYAGSAEVTILREPTTIRVCVADRGPGIPEDGLVKVFDPFTRLETSRNRETGGIGLGLALAQAIVQDAGGTITLANRPGGGLVATIALPTGATAQG